jgi:aryl-alcohol dehydrogenase-like predicted oxidoreductase
MNMEKYKLAKSGISFAPLAFGGNVFGWTVDEPASFKLLDQFTDAGFALIDTADVYSIWVPGNKGGESEAIIGKWLKLRGNRDSIVIATKVGKPMGPGKKGLSKKYIRLAVEDSLKRLQTDYIDIYQSHDDDPQTPMEETLGTFEELIREGKVKAIGASNFSPARLRLAMEVSKKNNLPAYECLQPLYNLMERKQFEDELEGICIEHNMAVISYYSLASGFLTGKYRSEKDLNKSPRGEGARKYLNAQGYAVLQVLDQLASELDTKPASIALAWLMARPSIAAPIASATNEEQLGTLIQAAQIKLDKDAIALLDKASAD